MQPLQNFGADDRMRKRRRTAEWNGGQAQGSTDLYADASAVDETSYGGVVREYATAAGNADEMVEQQGQTDLALTASSAPHPMYSDAATYQQPYYTAQQTDPATYTAPWPPITYDARYNASVPTSENMPFFPLSTGVATEQVDDIGIAAQISAYPDPNASAEYLYVGPQSGALQQYASSSYMDDASMQLKIQSLSILDNLVS
ncbi:hypothetical protein BAUCODRAFT_300222 [Baudoinia panamericana UAMH 10762]|uniref:Uncharacterized protein n=1 Tax=Baudoinia panamericana (strain UAMH 10762) TaxID=717646 RepID=M2M4V8_BAUPA|nr:uncharacterized protein BAUCODRAFT_300222 [Baudoinia panamericana UAMH 10762]EMC91641.1 hypothetical protein BAUCODRAFT_300222 [Baudoinia panamericana UAMH 10762]